MVSHTAASVLGVIASLVATAGAVAQTVIPVYAGATLVVDTADPTCCRFATRDPLASVVAFYQTRLGTAALTPEQAAQRSPALGAQLRALAAQLPPGVQYRVFVLPGGATFELLASPRGVSFSITQEQLGAPGAAYAQDFATRIAAAGGGASREGMDPTRQEYERWLGARPPATAADADIPVYSGARLESRDERSPGCQETMLITSDPVDQVKTFYATRLGPGYSRNESEEGTTFEHTEFEVQGLGAEDRASPVVVIGPSTAVNRRIQIGTADAMWRNVPRFDAEQRMVVMDRVAATTIAFSRQVPTQACVGSEERRFIRRPE